MFSTCCGGLEGAGDVELLPLTGTAAAGVTLEKEERPQLFAVARSREGWQKYSGPSRRKFSQLPRVRFPLPAHLCCCEYASWVPWLPERGSAGENLLMALGLGTKSCTQQLPGHNTSTNNSLARHSKPHVLAQLECGHEPAV